MLGPGRRFVPGVAAGICRRPYDCPLAETHPPNNSMNVYLVDSRSADTAAGTGALALSILFASSPPPLPGPAFTYVCLMARGQLDFSDPPCLAYNDGSPAPMYLVGGRKGRPGPDYTKGLWSGAQDDYSANDDEGGAAEPREGDGMYGQVEQTELVEDDGGHYLSRDDKADGRSRPEARGQDDRGGNIDPPEIPRPTPTTALLQDRPGPAPPRAPRAPPR